MAGDWMPMQVDLDEHPVVVALSLRCCSHVCHVVGALHRIWKLGNKHSVDGKLAGYTPELIDSQVGVAGFCEAVASHGWLRISKRGIEIIDFERWNGKGAKRRFQAAERMRTKREQNANTSATREEKSESESLTDTDTAPGADAFKDF